MNTQEAYNQWASQYDSNINKTRDLEAIALQDTLPNLTFTSCLEIGCGTGKNTSWLIKQANYITAVDLSEEMLALARTKIKNENVQFIQADILQDWAFANVSYDLVTFSLMLEHIENIEAVLAKAATVLAPGGHVYIGELHPFKQYTGSKARFETENGVQVVDCYTHHISDFIEAGRKNGLQLIELKEYFDENSHEIPRVLTLLLKDVRDPAGV